MQTGASVKHRRALTIAVLVAATCMWMCSRRAHAIDPAKALSECSVDTWRARGGVLSDRLSAGQHFDGRIADLGEDAEGTIWMATSEGIYKIAHGLLALVHAAAPPLERPTALHRDRSGRLWMGTADGLYIE